MARNIRTSKERETNIGAKAPKQSLTARLARWAGLADAPVAEQLERRELLFSLVVTADDVNPQTGVGTATGFFSYFVPASYQNILPTDTGPQVVTDNLNDENPGQLGSGQLLLDSGIRVRHNLLAPNSFAIRPPGQDGNERWIRANLTTPGDFYQFEFYDRETGNNRRRVTAASFNIFGDLPPDVVGNDITGMLTNNFRVTLLNSRNNQIIQTFTGAALQAQIQGGNPALGIGTFGFNAPANTGGFDTVRVELLTAMGGLPSFRIDDISYTVPPARFVGTLTPREFGAVVSISGPVGASATFFDLYGRDMLLGGVGVPTGQDLLNADLDDDGRPDFNDGIGRIVVDGVDSRSSLTVWGATVTATNQPQDNVDFYDGAFAYTITDSIVGNFDEFESAGFGYALDATQGQLRVTGLPPGPGSVIIGAPTGIVRPQNDYNPGQNAPGATNPITTGFTDASQGVQVNGSIGAINIAGVLHGSSFVRGYVDRWYTGYMVGSLTVDGDLGTFVSGSDAGQWSADPDFASSGVQIDPINKTGGQIVVGRSVGEIIISGRSQLDVTVVGDLNNATARPARNAFDYYEKEWVFGISTDIDELGLIRRNLGNGEVYSRDPQELFRGQDQFFITGDTFLRNDTIMGSEWIGSTGSGVRIKGQLSGQDNLNGEDTSDAFAFAVDGTTEIVIEGTDDSNVRPPYFRIVDQDGRTLAAPQSTGDARGQRFQTSRLTYKPTAPGILYIVVTDPNGNDQAVANANYTLVVTGMATATLGSYRTGGGSGRADVASGEGNSLAVLSGGVGAIRIGTGYVGGDGADASPSATYNTVENDDDSMSFSGGSFIVSGNLYGIVAGSDVGAPSGGAATTPIDFRISGNLGSLFTGLSPVAGGPSPNEGDLNFINLNIGGSIGQIDVRGGIGMDQDATDPRARLGPNIVTIRTGVSGGRGDIGFIRTGFHIGGDAMRVTTSPGSTLGGFLIAQDSYDDDPDADPRVGIYNGITGLPITSGFGSDVRFVDLPRLDIGNSTNIITPIFGDRPIELVDDSGVRVTIRVENGPPDVQIGFIRSMPIDGSQGVAIGAIEVDLTGGRILHITSGGNSGTSTGGVVSVGRIRVAGDAGSEIRIDGVAEVDVYRIEQNTRTLGSGTAFNQITNLTPGGDLVSVDIASLNRLEVFGDLGRTQVVAWGPQLIGLNLGVAAGLQGEVNAPLGFVNEDQTDDRDDGGGPLQDIDFSGEIFRPLGDDVFDAGNAYLDDIGGPFDGQLNGIVVRAGNVTEIRVLGAVGDVILQDAASVLVLLNANADRLTPVGRFEGIIGSIYAQDMGRIDIGDGLKASDGGPLATAGIFAADDIAEISSQKTSGVIISGIISASNQQDPDQLVDSQDGLATIRLVNGSIQDAFIGSMTMDAWWNSFLYLDDNRSLGDVGNVELTGTNIFRSRVAGRDLRRMRITNGFYDATNTDMSGFIGQVDIFGIRNSTLVGDLKEASSNIITGARDLNRLTVQGDMGDVLIDITGRVTQSIAAASLTRATLEVDGELKALTISTNMRSSRLNVGALPTLTVQGRIVSSEIFSSAEIRTVTAGDAILNTRIESTGPSGSIGTITAVNGVSGTFRSLGAIGTIAATAGDVIANVTTANDGSGIQSVTAGRDVVLVADIGGAIGTITAGRHIGRVGETGVILARGDIQNASAPNGQLYSDLRAGGVIGTVTIGSAANKPGNQQVGGGSIISFRSIGTVTVNSDFDGDIISYTGGIGTVTINNGSFLAGNTIAAYDGSINAVVINSGNLYGNIHADLNIQSVRVVADAAGVFGDVGLNSAQNAFTVVDARRNQLPPGMSITSVAQGPSITAGVNINSFVVTNGTVFESLFRAGQRILNISITGSVANDSLTLGTGSVFAAGDSIDAVTITGSVANAAFIAGVVSFGSDSRPGGTGTKADSLKSGDVKQVTIGGGVRDSFFAAGIDAGADGVYITADDRSVFGVSNIAALSLTGTVTNTAAWGDKLASSVSGDTRLNRGGTSLASTNAELDSGSGTPGTSFSGSRTFNGVGGANVTINVTGGGQAFFDTSARRLTLRNTTSSTNVTVSSSTGTIDSFDIVTNDDASLGTLNIQAALTGDSDIIVDGGITSLTTGNFSGIGSVQAGGDVGTATFGNLVGGFFSGRAVGTLRVNGDFGASNAFTTGEAGINALSLTTLNITGAARGTVSVDRDLGSVTASGGIERSSIRAGGSINSISTPSLRSSFIAAADAITSVAIGGDMFDSSVMAGLDLGRDAAFGGTGLNADAVSTGTINTVTVAGNFRESDVTAGYARGADGFFGTSDDQLAPGRSAIGQVTIAGTQVGSPRSSESYIIGSTGTVASLRIGGLPFGGSSGNFALRTPLLAPAPLQVKDIVVSVESLVFSANVIFNQPVDASSVSSAINISEIRGNGDIEIRLIEGIDYTLRYLPETNTVRVTFSRSLTSQNLPQVPGNPGPGVYRFAFSQSLLRGQLQNFALDGNSNGFVEQGDNFAGQAIVGDAGDKFTPAIVQTGINNTTRLDFYGPSNLDFVLDTVNGNGLPDVNKSFTVRGFIGDHADNDSNFFRFGGDVDLYSVTLQAGQIIRLSELNGSAIRAGLAIFGPNGTQLNTLAANAQAVSLPVRPGEIGDLSFPVEYLVKVTGTYTIAVGNVANVGSNAVTNPEVAPPLGVGDYSFNLQVFDDGDSGFTNVTEAGNGDAVVNAPEPIQFAGTNGVFGDSDDVAVRVIGNFSFTHSYGTDGLPNTADDIVTGGNGTGMTSTRVGTSSGSLTSTIDSSIGPAGHAGIPRDYAPDVDVFHLNNRLPIAPGSKMRITVRLADLGADLGSVDLTNEVDNRGSVQFALFDTSDSTNIDDATLVFSPTDFLPNASTPNRTIAQDGSTKYGYDAKGDFYIEFVTPDRAGIPGASGTFAVYLQGVYNTDYQLEVVTNGTGTIERRTQNVFIETAGGQVDWLRAGGLLANLTGFSSRTLGFSGTTTNGQPVDEYILSQLVSSLGSLFQGDSLSLDGFDIRFSTNPADFEGQPFSTVFLTSANDPVAPIFDPFNAFNFLLRGGAFVNTQPYGFSQHSDPFNTDVSDEAVVFIPSFALQGLSPSQADVDAFVQSLTAAVGRRVGELVGLRVSNGNGANANTFDFQGADSVDNVPGPGNTYDLTAGNRFLSDPFDSVDRTNFFLGQQNVFSILDKILGRV